MQKTFSANSLIVLVSRPHVHLVDTTYSIILMQQEQPGRSGEYLIHYTWPFMLTKWFSSMATRALPDFVALNIHKIPEAPLTVAINCWRRILRNHLKAKQELVKARLPRNRADFGELFAPASSSWDRNSRLWRSSVLRNIQGSSDEYLTIQKEFLNFHKAVAK